MDFGSVHIKHSLFSKKQEQTAIYYIVATAQTVLLLTRGQRLKNNSHVNSLAVGLCSVRCFQTSR